MLVSTHKIAVIVGVSIEVGAQLRLLLLLHLPRITNKSESVFDCVSGAWDDFHFHLLICALRMVLFVFVVSFLFLLLCIFFSITIYNVLSTFGFDRLFSSPLIHSILRHNSFALDSLSICL